MDLKGVNLPLSPTHLAATVALVVVLLGLLLVALLIRHSRAKAQRRRARTEAALTLAPPAPPSTIEPIAPQGPSAQSLPRSERPEPAAGSGRAEPAAGSGKPGSAAGIEASEPAARSGNTTRPTPAPDGSSWPEGTKDRLLRVLLPDPDRALHAVGDLEQSRGQLDTLHDRVHQQRRQLADAARRLRGAGLTAAQVARLAGFGEGELASLLAEHVPSPMPRTPTARPSPEAGSGSGPEPAPNRPMR